MFAAAAEKAGLALLASAALTAGCAAPNECYLDADGDGFGIGDPFSADACADVSAAAVPGDCDDSRDWIRPGAYDASDDGIDADCDGVDQVTCYADADGDGFGAGPFEVPSDECDGVADRTTVRGDCDDTTAARSPENTEIPDDGVDQDCDGSDLISCFYDGDEDGHGFATPSFVLAGSCGDDPHEVLIGDDCDDSRPDIHPGALETCDRIDQDCDGTYDAGDWHYLSGGTEAWFDAGVVPLPWGAFTIEMRLDVHSSGVEAGRPLLHKTGPDGETELRIDNGDGDSWAITIGGQSPGGVPGPEVFHFPDPGHLAIVSEGPGLRFYVDGELATSWQGAAPTTWSDEGTWTFLADVGTGARSLLVDLKELRMWSTVRTQAQLVDGHCRPLRSQERAGLELYVPFENGGTDYSGNGRNPVYTNGHVHAPGGL